jgi:hypothetical protein
MTFNVQLAKLQGQRLLDNEEHSRLASFCIAQGLPLSIEEESVCLTIPELLRGTKGYLQNLRTEIMKEYKPRN